jgi:hypothetical protein
VFVPSSVEAAPHGFTQDEIHAGLVGSVGIAHNEPDLLPGTASGELVPISDTVRVAYSTFVGPGAGVGSAEPLSFLVMTRTVSHLSLLFANKLVRARLVEGSDASGLAILHIEHTRTI